LCSLDELILSPSQQNTVRRIQEVAPPTLDHWDDKAILNRTEIYWRIFVSDLSIVG
jgi:hypothetical protein